MFADTFTLMWPTNWHYVCKHIHSDMVYQLVLYLQAHYLSYSSPACVVFTCTFFWTWFVNPCDDCRHIHSDAAHRLALQQVYLYWVCPDMHAFEWFQQLLQSMEAQVAESGDPLFLHHYIYLTRGWDNDQVSTYLLVLVTCWSQRGPRLHGELSCLLQFQLRAVELDLPDLLLTFVSG